MAGFSLHLKPKFLPLTTQLSVILVLPPSLSELCHRDLLSIRTICQTHSHPGAFESTPLSALNALL